jgi:hypothetical protein
MMTETIKLMIELETLIERMNGVPVRTDKDKESRRMIEECWAQIKSWAKNYGGFSPEQVALAKNYLADANEAIDQHVAHELARQPLPLPG